jgi:LysR family transcriptional regulator, low CO2-responsive transcriptional regulator
MNPIHNRQNPLDTRQLHAFASLARTRSFTDTAHELFLTRSAISHAMSALQAEIGCRLLTIMGKRVFLTQEGEAFLHYVTIGLNAFTKARQSVEELNQWGSQRLRLGAGGAICRLLLPPVLAVMRRQYPRLIVSAAVVHPWEMVATLEKGDLDYVLGEPPHKLPQIEFTHLFDSPLRIVVSSKHPWAVQGRIDFGELSKEPCLLTDKSHPTRRLVDRYFAQEKVKMNQIAEIESFDAIKVLVRQGFGISILPDWVVKEDLAAGVLTAFAPGRRRLTQSWGLLRWQGRPITSVENSFMLSCLAAAKSL